jgi:rhodanese-related sulfurtransferase
MNQNIPLNISPKELNKILNDDSSEKPFIVDVREDDEIAIASFSFTVLHLPLSQAANWSAKIGELLPKDQPIVVACHAGVRSLNFGIWLLELGIAKSVFNLAGGIDAWSTDVDQSVPKY